MYNEAGQPQLFGGKHWKDLSDDLKQRLQHEHQNPKLLLTADQKKIPCLYNLE